LVLAPSDCDAHVDPTLDPSPAHTAGCSYTTPALAWLSQIQVKPMTTSIRNMAPPLFPSPAGGRCGPDYSCEPRQSGSLSRI
jgi:hypothetical protein